MPCRPQTAIRSNRSGCMVIRFTPKGLSVSALVAVISVSSSSGVIAPQAITPKPPALLIADTRLRSDTHDIAPHSMAHSLPRNVLPRSINALVSVYTLPPSLLRPDRLASRAYRRQAPIAPDPG